MRANLVQPELVDRAEGQGELNHIFGGKVSCINKSRSKISIRLNWELQNLSLKIYWFTMQEDE